LLIPNEGFLSPGGTIPSSEIWLKSAGVSPEMVAAHATAFEKHCENFDYDSQDRILLKDAERIFKSTAGRLQLVQMLSYLQKEFNSYHQGLALSGAFVLLFLDVTSTISLFSAFNSNEKYLPNIWQREAINMATDGYVFQEMLHQLRPDLAKHLLSLGVLPEMYCQKYWCALNVMVLPFEAQFRFMTSFCERGFRAVFHFALSLACTLESQLLRCVDPGSCLEFLRLDSDNKAINRLEMAREVVNCSSDYKLDSADYPALRKHAFEAHLASRTYYAEDTNKRESVMCQICKEEDAEYYCPQCKKDMCETCMDDNPPPNHEEEEHGVFTQEEKEEEGCSSDSGADNAAEGLASLTIKGTGLTPVPSPVVSPSHAAGEPPGF